MMKQDLLKCNDVSIYDDYISLNIAKSKTDQS